MASQVEVLSHWYKSLEKLQLSSLEFYKAIEGAIDRRQVPDVETSRVDRDEGGVLSAKREYLRAKRGRLIFDICAAPFGTGFFVSWWLVETTPSSALATLATVGGSFFLLYFFVNSLGIVLGFLFFLVCLFVAFAIVASAVSQGAAWADPFLEIPVLGLVIRFFFQPLTYYRIDTALMFQTAIHDSVLEVVEDLLKTKGLRPLSESERKPILKDFLRR